MAKVKVLMLRAPGTNCDFETQVAYEMAGAVVDSALVTELFRGEKRLDDCQVLVIPGGFTYGDDISAGRIFANEIKLRLGEDVRKFIAAGKLVMGVCNGFQVLVKTGILPGIYGRTAQPVTLLEDDNRFTAWLRWQDFYVSHHEIVVVLDNYHLVSGPAVRQAVGALLEYMPRQMHLVITTRSDPPLPLARLRASGDLTEVREAELRYTSDEAREFLNQAMGLDLADEQVAALVDRTEG